MSRNNPYDLSALDPLVQQDIHELENKLAAFQNGSLPDENFRAYRLTRGIYGQRQEGVQMIRVKLPFGHLKPDQLDRIAHVAETYGHGVLHATTRQDIQLHYVHLADTPAVWAELEQKQVTLREACGNTVRNITASSLAGIDPAEPFDVSPHAYTMAYFFMRNPICQDMGRKFKIAFSSSEADTAYTYFHDLGFIPRLRHGVRGFGVVVGGGLGAQPFAAQTVADFMPEEQIIPFTAALLRVFDRYGERTRRNKARIKFLLKDIGLAELMKRVEEERKVLGYEAVEIPESFESIKHPSLPTYLAPGTAPGQAQAEGYARWQATNVLPQKQAGWVAVQIRLSTGNMTANTARELANLARNYASDDMRMTVNQGILLKYVRPQNLPALHAELAKLGLAEPGFGGLADITACPGTDTCNLGIASSMGLARVLEKQLEAEYPTLSMRKDLQVKISGCMNSCGQHEAAAIGLRGSSLKVGNKVLPAMQVVLGGGVDAQGKGHIADKIIKLPTKRIPQALRILLDDYVHRAEGQEPYLAYYLKQEKHYFYNLLKPLAGLNDLQAEEYQDWERKVDFVPAIGVGECAVPQADLVSIVFQEAREKLSRSLALQQQQHYPDAIYTGYTALVLAAKGYLLGQDVACNTQIGIIQSLDTHLGLSQPFSETVLGINQQEPTEAFAAHYLQQATTLVAEIEQHYNRSLHENPIAP